MFQLSDGIKIVEFPWYKEVAWLTKSVLNLILSVTHNSTYCHDKAAATWNIGRQYQVPKFVPEECTFHGNNGIDNIEFLH